MKRLTILAIVAILILSASGCRRGSRCFGLRGSPCGRPTVRLPWKKPQPQPQVIYQAVPVPMPAPANVCPPPQDPCDPCPPMNACPAPGYPGYTVPTNPAVPGTTVQPYTQGYGTMGQILPGGVIDGGVISDSAVSGAVPGTPTYGNIIGDRVLQPSQTPPGLETVPLNN